jgi:hypothetical protein
MHTSSPLSIELPNNSGRRYGSTPFRQHFTLFKALEVMGQEFFVTFSCPARLFIKDPYDDGLPFEHDNGG